MTVPNLKFIQKDLEILEFILKMKFANVEDIQKRFFRFKKSGEISNCLRWAQFRLSLLTKHNLLNRVANLGPRLFYTVTSDGYYLLKRMKSTSSFCKPIDEIDIRTFEHDHQLIQIRNYLEQNENVSEWVSDRELSESIELRSQLPGDCRPDAIFKTSDNLKVALELEKARKSKDRYQQKIRSYIKLITETDKDSRAFDQVYFVCETKPVLELIKYQCELYQYLFRFNLLENLIQKNGN